MRKTSILARAVASIFCAIAIVVAPFAQAKSAQEIFAAVAAGVVVVFALDETGEQIGQGSGVVVGENEVVTNCHVVADARAVAVRQAADSRGRRTYLMDARMAARDEERDLCLLFVSELSEPPAAIPTAAGRARDLSIGEEVFAVGAPRGLDLSLTRGIVSQLRGDFGKQSAPVIQTDAAISPGSSGGGLFNEDGKLVGITAFKHSGEDSEGLSFAVPAEWVAELQAQAVKEIAAERKRQKCLSSPTVDCLFEIALQTAKKIDGERYRAPVLRDIAAAFAETGHGVDAKNTFANALRSAEKIEDAVSHARSLRNIAIAQAEAGFFPNALRTAEKIESVDWRASSLFERSDWRASALRGIAAAFAKAGHGVDAKNTFANALRIAEKIEAAPSRTPTLREIATAQAEAGLFPDALRTAEKIRNALSRDFSLRDIATAQAEADLFPNALQTANKIEDERYRASVLGDIAAAFARAEHSVDAKNTFANALRTANKIEDERYRASVLGDIATAFARAEHSIVAKNTFANALRTAEKIETAFYRDSALRDIAVAFANAGFSPNALRTAEKIEDADNRAYALRDIVAAFADAGFFPNALRTAEKIEDASLRTIALGNIAAAFAEAGFFSNALQTAEKIEGIDNHRAFVLRGIAIAQAEAGDIKNAIEISAKIGDERAFARALARIAVELAKAG